MNQTDPQIVASLIRVGLAHCNRCKRWLLQEHVNPQTGFCKNWSDCQTFMMTPAWIKTHVPESEWPALLPEYAEKPKDDQGSDLPTWQEYQASWKAENKKKRASRKKRA